MHDILNTIFPGVTIAMSRSGTTPGILLSGILLSSLFIVAACSNSAVEDPLPTVSVDSSSQNSIISIPTSLLQLEDDAGLLAEIPNVVATETLAETGLQVAYTDTDQPGLISALNIQAQWVHMQSCLEQVAPSPLVVVRQGPVTPFTSADDVIHSIEGIPVASVSARPTAVFQIQISDFDGSLGTPAFNLRSIMGRYLWLAANLPERDYPFTCAQQVP